METRIAWTPRTFNNFQITHELIFIFTFTYKPDPLRIKLIDISIILFSNVMISVKEGLQGNISAQKAGLADGQMNTKLSVFEEF